MLGRTPRPCGHTAAHMCTTPRIVALFLPTTLNRVTPPIVTPYLHALPGPRFFLYGPAPMQPENVRTAVSPAPSCPPAFCAIAGRARPPPPTPGLCAAADLVPRQEEVGQRVPVPGLPLLLLPLLLRPRLQDARGVRKGALAGKACPLPRAQRQGASRPLCCPPLPLRCPAPASLLEPSRSCAPCRA